jgi:hypothetical protein
MAPATPAQTVSTVSAAPLFRLEKHQAFWFLIRGNETAVLKHEVGLDYVAYLMAHPDQEIHGLALAFKVRAARAGQNPDAVDVVQERALALDDAEASRQLYLKQLKLEAIVDDESTPDPVKEEVQRELLEIYEFQKRNVLRTNTAAQKASDAVGKAIKRLHSRLTSGTAVTDSSARLVRSFATFILVHILVPSGRCLAGGHRPEGSGGYFIYKPD